MTADESDPRTAFDKAAGAVHDATESVQVTSQSIAGAIEAGPPARRLARSATRLTREAPLRSLAIAFLFGLMISRRR
jgi:hypothetical protein